MFSQTTPVYTCLVWRPHPCQVHPVLAPYTAPPYVVKNRPNFVCLVTPQDMHPQPRRAQGEGERAAQEARGRSDSRQPRGNLASRTAPGMEARQRRAQGKVQQAMAEGSDQKLKDIENWRGPRGPSSKGACPDTAPPSSDMWHRGADRAAMQVSTPDWVEEAMRMAEIPAVREGADVEKNAVDIYCGATRKRRIRWQPRKVQSGARQCASKATLALQVLGGIRAPHGGWLEVEPSRRGCTRMSRKSVNSATSDECSTPRSHNRPTESAICPMLFSQPLGLACAPAPASP